MGPCAASVETDGALIARISGGGETLSVIPISNATNLNGVGAGMVGWFLVGTDTAETSSTTTVINATTHAARVGDILSFTAGTAGNIGVWSVVSAVGADTITLSYALPATPANGDAFSIMRPNPFFAPKEDTAHATGDMGVQLFAVSNQTGKVDFGASGDYVPLGVTNAGVLYTNINANILPSSDIAASIIKLEDAASGGGEAGVAQLVKLQSALTADAAAEDYGFVKASLDGRLITAPAPAGEFFSSCSGTITGTSRTAIKSGVASNRIYTTSITCSNSGAAASIFNISDGAGAQLAVGALAATVGSYTASFPTPLRGSVATDLSVTMNTTSTSTICCANGFISTT